MQTALRQIMGCGKYSTSRCEFGNCLRPSPPSTFQGAEPHGRLQACDLPIRRRPPCRSRDRRPRVRRRQARGQARLFHGAQHHQRLDGRQGRPEGGGRQGRQGPGEGPAARQDQAARAPALALHDLLRRIELCRPRRRDGPQKRPADRARSPYPRAQGLAFHQGRPGGDRPGRDGQDFRRLRQGRLGGGTGRRHRQAGP